MTTPTLNTFAAPGGAASRLGNGPTPAEMLFLRSALYLLYLIAVVIPWAFVVLSGWLFPVHTRYFLCACYTKMAIWARARDCGIEWKVEGWDNLPDGPAILLPKHQSSWETLWLPLR